MYKIICCCPFKLTIEDTGNMEYGVWCGKPEKAH